MKKRFNIVMLIIPALMALSSCRQDNIIGDPKHLIEGAYVTLTTQGNATLDYLHFDTSTVTINVGGVGSPIASVNLYVVLGQNLNPAAWSFVKAVPFTEGVLLSLTGAEIARALGIDPDSINNNVTIYPEAVTKDGRKFSSRIHRRIINHSRHIIWPSSGP